MTAALTRRLDHLERLLTVAEEQVEFLGVVMARSTAERIVRSSMGRSVEPVSPSTRDIPHQCQNPD
ncbi:MAG: hypothetical protein EOM22_18580 [Gammaproteobacteria bacterium]|nr:hypothetical protein [Gammaproteobacteria bacterium]